MNNSRKHDPTCNECFLYEACGGVDEELGVASCLTLDPAECRERGWANFRDPKDFAFRWSETRGFNAPFRGEVCIPSGEALPLYAPALYHAARRTQRLDLGWAAIPLYTFIRRKKDGTFGSIARDGASLRHAFGLTENVRIIVTSVAPDAYLEEIWSQHQQIELAAILRSLDIQAVTVPNFSYFEDAPPVHTLYNRARMLRIAERFSSAGLPVVPHLNAFAETHWRFWTAFLREHSKVIYVCKEFQTGFRSAAKGAKAYKRLVQLRDDLGRDLHPILVAGQRFLPEMKRDFGTKFTVVDAVPFIKTYHRQFLKPGDDVVFNWKTRRTPRGQPLDDRLWENVNTYRARLQEKAAGRKALQGQLNLTGFMSATKRDLPLQQSVAALDLFKWNKTPERDCEPSQQARQSPSQTASRTGLARNGCVDSSPEIRGRLPVPK